MDSQAAQPVSADPAIAPVSRQTRHIGFLDQVRGLAILAVFVLHTAGASCRFDRLPWRGWHRRLPETWTEWLLAPATFGWVGVAIFFVVSGFCIHLSFRRKPVWQDFAVRRFFRIYPPYFLAVLFCACLFPLTRLDFHQHSSWVQLGTHLALIHNFGNTTLYGLNGAFWSIAVEAQLYALYPLLLLLARQLGWEKALGVTALIELAFGLACYAFLDRAPGEDPLKNVPLLLLGFPLRYWFSWSVGAYLAELHLRGGRWPLTGFRPFGLLLLAAVGAEMTRYLQMFSFTLFALATAAGITTLLANGTPVWRGPRFLSTRLATTGRWSYSIYLLHFPFLVWVALALPSRLPTEWNRPWILFGLTLASWLFIKPLSGLWYYFFEMPGIALGKKVAKALESGRKEIAVDEKGKRDYSGV